MRNIDREEERMTPIAIHPGRRVEVDGGNSSSGGQGIQGS